MTAGENLWDYTTLQRRWERALRLVRGAALAVVAVRVKPAAVESTPSEHLAVLSDRSVLRAIRGERGAGCDRQRAGSESNDEQEARPEERGVWMHGAEP